MTTLVLRDSGSIIAPGATAKGSPLTNLEVDNNFSNLSITVGILTNLTTTSTSNVVSAINSIKAGNLRQFGTTTSADLASVISNETGSGSLVFATAPTLVTPELGLATGTSVMLSANVGAAAGNISGNFTAGNYQTTGNVNGVNGNFTTALTAGTLQTTGNVNASSLRVTTNSTVGTVVSGTWQGTVIATTYGGTGNGSGYASGGAASAATATVVDDTSTNATYYPMLGQATSGNTAPKVSSTKLTFNPSSGLLTSTDYNSSSDITLKEDIVLISNPLDIISKLNGYSFKWKESGEKALGLSAQEVEKILPEVVKERPDGTKGINYMNFIAVLIESIKQLKQEIQELKSYK